MPLPRKITDNDALVASNLAQATATLMGKRDLSVEDAIDLIGGIYWHALEVVQTVAKDDEAERQREQNLGWDGA